MLYQMVVQKGSLDHRLDVGYTVFSVVYLHGYGEFQRNFRRFLLRVQFSNKVVLEYFGDALKQLDIYTPTSKNIIDILPVAVQPSCKLAHTYARCRHLLLY